MSRESHPWVDAFVYACMVVTVLAFVLLFLIFVTSS